MIFCFSGTGNSRYVAEMLSRHLPDEVSEMTNSKPLNNEVLGIVFPVYAWGLPNIVEQFLAHSLKEVVKEKPAYVYTVMTCGTDMGYADRLVSSLLKKSGISLDAAFSVIMPNTYVSLPGFDVDSDDAAARKVALASQLVPEIAMKISAKEKVTEVARGSFPHFKTTILRRFFNRYLMSDKPFHVDDLRCSHCGKCIRQCPVGNITMTEQKQLLWKGKGCTGCLGCYHACPHRAIRYGRWTDNKGQKQPIEQ